MAATGTAAAPVFQTTETERSATAKVEKNLFLATAEYTRALRTAGYCIIEKWEYKDPKKQDTLPQQEMQTYLHSISYDFEVYHGKTRVGGSYVVVDHVH